MNEQHDRGQSEAAHQARYRPGTVAGSAAQVEEAIRQLAAEISGDFGRVESHRAAMEYLRKLLSGPRRRTPDSEEPPAPLPRDRIQRLLNGSSWDAERIRDHLYRYAHRIAATDDAPILAVGEVGFLKRGPHSAGVALQRNPSTGNVENCQIGVFGCLVTKGARILVDRELYLPPVWFADPERIARAAIPSDVSYRSRDSLATEIIVRMTAAGIPFRWVVGDVNDGFNAGLRQECEVHHIHYVVAVREEEAVPADGGCEIRVADLVGRLPDWPFVRAPHRRRAGPPLEWAGIALPDPGDRSRRRLLLVAREAATHQNLEYYLCAAPPGTTTEELVRVAERRWAVTDAIRVATDRVGLSNYEVRKMPAWYSHITLAMMACAVSTRAQNMVGDWLSALG